MNQEQKQRLTDEELAEQTAAALPDREALSVISPLPGAKPMPVDGVSPTTGEPVSGVGGGENWLPGSEYTPAPGTQ
jgi:hypothetical protein